MFFGVQSYVKQLNYFVHVSDVFDKDEVEKILDLEDLNNFKKGRVGRESPEGVVDEKVRDSEIIWINPDENSIWLFQKFGHLTSMVNNDHFMYSLKGFDAFQYTRYKPNGHYNWHIDSHSHYLEVDRKISATIVLSDPSEYEGGEFEIILNGQVETPHVLKPKIGDVIFFASWLPHRVRPVISGVRKSLVAWIVGDRIC